VSGSAELERPTTTTTATATATTATRTHQSLAAQISTRLVKLLALYTGRGPTKARTTIDQNVIVVVAEDALTRAEMNLTAAGQAGSVAEVRRRFASIMRADAIAMIEELTNRSVRAYLSDISPDANVATHVFVLHPLPEL
jgi:uncharacterized protein YbcI